MIYFARSCKTEYIKVGYTTDYSYRYPVLVARFGALDLLGLMPGTVRQEHILHRLLRHLNVKHVDGREWFYPKPELLEYIRLNCRLSLDSSERRLTVLIELPDELAGVLTDIARMNSKRVPQIIEDITRRVYPDYQPDAGEREHA